jgi:hypothetical protein
MVVQIDGIHISEHLVLVAALGIDSEGFKRPLGLMEGATEHSAVVQALIDDLIERGLDPAVPPRARCGTWRRLWWQSLRHLCVAVVMMLGCRRHGGRQSPWLSLNGRDRIADFGDTESPLVGIHEFRKEQCRAPAAPGDTGKGAAHITGSAKGTIRRWIKSGALPAITDRKAKSHSLEVISSVISRRAPRPDRSSGLTSATASNAARRGGAGSGHGDYVPLTPKWAGPPLSASKNNGSG